MTDFASRAPAITVFEDKAERNNNKNAAAEVKQSLLRGWMQHRGRPPLLRVDPDGAYVLT
eukprot:4117292-Alexandrium_andersonii.AAC.1